MYNMNDKLFSKKYFHSGYVTSSLTRDNRYQYNKVQFV
jgi:hypothetical protein